jgi:ATP adenylyltransferase
MAFIQGEKSTGCFFCQKARDRDDRANHVVLRGTHGFVLLNAYPYATGHLLIAPYDHVSELDLLPAAVTGEMMELTKRSIRALRRAVRADSYNVGMNLGAVAGAGVADHLHLHVVPRWVGDSNFMSVVGDVRLIPEALDTTWEKLTAAFAAEA